MKYKILISSLLLGNLIYSQTDKDSLLQKDVIEHTERMIEITKKYGFPSVKRIKKYYSKDFVNPEFNPLIIFIHSPKKYWRKLKELMLNEYNNGTINQCQYGYMLWPRIFSLGCNCKVNC